MKKIALALLIFFALFLRTYHISQVPPALSWDEVSIGYNAYSILKTGRDEHGKFLPIDTFVAYGDYKPPLAIYLTVPSIALFGLSEFGVRFPSAFFGTLTVLMTYFLVKELFRRTKNHEPVTRNLPTIASLLLAISPWHINLSRAGFEANIALFFIVLGVYFILLAREKYKYWYVAWVPFVASIYTFNSARYFTPLFAIVLCIFVRKDIRQYWKACSIGVIVALMCLLPIIPHLVSKEARLRFAEVNIFTDNSVVVTSNERIAYDKNSMIGKILHNRRVGFALSYLRHFADNLQPSFLFIQGDGNPKFSTRVVGQLYIIEAPLLAIGIFSMFALYPQVAWILLFWIILAIVPAATARETPHALRILNSLPAWQIFIAYGILSIPVYIKQLRTKNPALPAGRHEPATTNQQPYLIIYMFLLVAIYAFSFGYYLHNYYSHYATKYSGEWQYGYREAILAAQAIDGSYDTIYLTSSIGRPYMYTLFYTRYDPIAFMRTKDTSFDTAGFYHVNGFGKYRFVDSMPVGGLKTKTLYITDPDWVPGDARILRTITLLDGTKRLILFDKP